MQTRYLFRLDMAKDNDEFLALRRTRQVDHVYSGTPMKVGPGWIPDFLELVVDRDSQFCRLTLIELEATEIAARASCRKYLPEPSSEIMRAFVGHLDTVISQCRSTADPRLDAFEGLKEVVVSSSTIVVHTAGALRTSPDLLEDLPLIDQPERPALAVVDMAKSPSSFVFIGDRRLTRAEADGVRRATRILHAVIVGRDHSGGTMKSWRNISQKPLDRAVAKEQNRYPHLHKLLTARTEHGLNINCEEVATELARLWRVAEGEPMTADRAAAMVSTFVPVAVTFEGHEPMQNVFARARETLRGTAI
jgi:hypothetical protein